MLGAIILLVCYYAVGEDGFIDSLFVLLIDTFPYATGASPDWEAKETADCGR